ncbi:MAG: hypothetical protein JO015_12200 [Verrucomicrobia bacterium]|nr:hypothetical protein [Verrucomicrobiota bacterium]
MPDQAAASVNSQFTSSWNKKLAFYESDAARQTGKPQEISSSAGTGMVRVRSIAPGTLGPQDLPIL